MRRILFVLAFCSICRAEEIELKYRLGAPKGWDVWMLTATDIDAISNYTYRDDGRSRAYILEKIRKGSYVPYKPGTLAIALTNNKSRGACNVRVLDGASRSEDGWVHCGLLKITEESKAYLEKSQHKKRIAQQKKEAAIEEVRRRQLAHINSLPRLSGQGDKVVVATSVDCASDLQSVVNFGRKNGTGLEFRKKMLELITLGCATLMENGTPMANATKNGQFVTFKSYTSGKEGVALLENVRWP